MAEQTLTDQDLRKELSKYMIDVPPVTETTRNILQKKLSKMQSMEQTPLGETIVTLESAKIVQNGNLVMDSDINKEVAISTEISKGTPKKSIANSIVNSVSTPVKTATLRKRVQTTTESHIQDIDLDAVSTLKVSPKSNVTVVNSLSRNASVEKIQKHINLQSPEYGTTSPQNNLSSDTNTSADSGSVIYDDQGCRIRRIPATRLPDYPDFPVFRRQSLQRNAANPYSEIIIRSPIIQGRQDAKHIINRVLNSSTQDINRSNKTSMFSFGQRMKTNNYSSYASPNKSSVSFSSKIYTFVTTIMLYVVGFLYLPFLAIGYLRKFVVSHISLPSWRVVLPVICLLMLIAAIVSFFLWDPFYYNPARDIESVFTAGTVKRAKTN